MDNVSQAVSWSTAVMGLSMGIARCSVGALYDLRQDATICFIAGGTSLLIASVMYVMQDCFLKQKKLSKSTLEENCQNSRSSTNEIEVTHL